MKKRMLLLGFMLGFYFCMIRSSDSILANQVQPEQEMEVTGYEDVMIPFYASQESALNKKGEFPLKWYIGIDEVPEEMEISYQVQLDHEEGFSKAQEFQTKDRKFTMDKNILGKQGGTFYIRVRTCVSNLSGAAIYSDWSETKKVTFLAITKHNFPGIYKLLKKGGRYYGVDGVKEIVYDTNEDGWLDESELTQITQLGTVNETKKKNGRTYSVPYMKISSLEGVEHLPNLWSVNLSQFSGTKVDLSKNKVQYVWIKGLTSTSIELIAPDAKDVFVEAHFDTAMKKMDFRACKSAKVMSVYGANKTKNVYLPKYKKNLTVLSVSDLSLKQLNLNSYTNLQQLYLYKTKVDMLKINKCKNLRYLYFYFVESLKKLDVTPNKKLRGMDIYKTPTLTAGTVKAWNKTKVTWQQGKWWYSTNAYKKDMQKIME